MESRQLKSFLERISINKKKLNCWVTSAIHTYNSFSERTINNIIIPGSHESGLYMYNKFPNINLDSLEFNY